MDSYEKMRKMNELAKDLKQHGFAESSFEAIQQASQIYGDDELTPEVKHGLILDSSQLSGQGETMEVDVDRKIKKVQDEIDVLTGKMNEIIKALNDMDARINQIKRAPEPKVEPRHEEKPKEAEHQEQPKAEHTETAPKTGEYENQRVGKFQSEDVA